MWSKALVAVVVGMLCVMMSGLASADMGPAISKDKKLIGFAVNALEPAYLRDHIAEVEQRMILDGLVISVYPDDWQYARTGQEDMFFGGRRFTRDDFKQALADLKATKFKRYTDNFIQFSTNARGARYTGEADGNLDWFDPSWSVVAENGAVLAWLAREAGFKGFFFDVEYYGGDPGSWNIPFSYSSRPDKDKRSYKEVAAQVRKRGREWMEAVTAAYPDISIVIIQNTGWSHPKTRGLVAHFVDGMLEGAGPKVRLADGGEYGYWQYSYKDFEGLVQAGKRKGTEMSNVPELFKKRIKHEVGICIDEDNTRSADRRMFYSKSDELQKNFRSPEALENTLYQALSATDRYAWLYLGHQKYFYMPELLQKENLWKQPKACPLCPHSEFPQAYIDALRNSRNPHDLSWDKFRTPEYYRSVAATFGPGDIPVDERFRATMIKSFDPDVVSMRGPGGKKPVKTALYVDPGASLTDEGLKVTGDRGVEYDARVLVFNWAGRYDYEMTLEFWHKYEGGGRLLTIGQYDRSPTPVYQVIYIATDDRGVRICVDRTGNKKNVARADYAFEEGKWYHFALVSDPNKSNPYGTKTDGITRLYINGKEVIAAEIDGQINPDWANDAVIRLGGSPDRDVGGTPAGPGRGVYVDLVITRGLKYRGDFTPPPRSSK